MCVCVCVCVLCVCVCLCVCTCTCARACGMHDTRGGVLQRITRLFRSSSRAQLGEDFGALPFDTLALIGAYVELLALPLPQQIAM